MPSKMFPDAINSLALFAGISPEERDNFLRAGHIRKLSRGEYIFHRGDPVKHFYIVCSGNVQLIRETPDGKEITTDITSRGKTIGKMDILQAFHQHTASACAIDDVQVLEFPATWLKEIAKHPVISLNILSSMSQYVHMVEIESEQKSTMSVAQRIGCFLQRLCVMHGFDPRGFELPYGKAYSFPSGHGTGNIFAWPGNSQGSWHKGAECKNCFLRH